MGHVITATVKSVCDLINALSTEGTREKWSPGREQQWGNQKRKAVNETEKLRL